MDTSEKPLFRNLRSVTDSEEEIKDHLSRIDELETRLEEIAKRLDRSPKQNLASAELDSLTGLADEAQSAVNEAIETLKSIAGIELPEDRSQRLLKEIDVYRLQEHYEDKSLFFALASLFAGAGLGILVNWATAETITLGKSGWVAFAIFGLVTGVFVWLWIRASKRSTRLQSR